MAKMLVVVDMQNDFITGPLGTPEAQAIVPRVIERVKNFDGTVVYTQDSHKENYLNTQEGKNLPVPHCIEGSEGWKLIPELEELSKASCSKIYEKRTFGSMPLARGVSNGYSTEKLTEVELIGVCTDICIISNAMLIKAMAPEVIVKVRKDCCAGTTVENHQRALEAMKPCQIQII